VVKIMYTDLSGEDPGPGSIVEVRKERVEVEGGLLGGTLKIKSLMNPGSPLYMAVITIGLTLAGCASAITLSVIGAPAWGAAAALLLPAAVFAIWRWQAAKAALSEPTRKVIAQPHSIGGQRRPERTLRRKSRARSRRSGRRRR
jgi:hypothetical protein